MIQTFNNARIDAGKNSGHERANGMKKIGAFAAQLRCLEHEAAANMKKNEACDNRRVPQNPRAHLGLQRHIGRKSEVFGTNHEPANNQRDHPDQDTRGQKVRQPVEWPPKAPSRMKRYEALQYIDQIHQKIKYKPIENQRVKKRDDRPRLQNRSL